MNNGGYAFGTLYSCHPDYQWSEPGMTMRDYFAAKAMAAILSRDGYQFREENPVAEQAYALADLMLRERESNG